MKPDLRTPWLVLSLVLIIGCVLQWSSTRRVLSRANSILLEAGFRGLCRALDDAYRLHDDLLPQNIMAALAQAPGVDFACVMDRRHSILAHSDPSRIGRPMDASNLKRVWTRTLAEGGSGQAWGWLLISRSDTYVRQTLRSQMAGLLLFSLSLVGCVSLFVRRWASVFRQSLSQLEELRFRCRELDSQEQRERGRREGAHLRWTIWIQEALDRVPVPTVLLDEAQRLVAWSPCLRERLGGSTERPLAGISWQDVPVLADCGEPLQNSLDHPGQKIETLREDCRIVFVSDSSPLSAGTWITFHSSSLS